MLSNSIAFHNSDLSPDERALVERHFRSGGVRVLFSTSTLAMGLNLPVKNVILDGKRWQYLKRYGRWSLEDVSKSEYENMSGRAGRLAHTKDFGRSILVTNSPFEADVWLKHYVGSDFEDIVPTLKEAPLENHVLNLLASGLAERQSDLAELLLSSFTGHVHWGLAFEAALSVRFEWVLHVGDFGIWPDANRVDKATKKHDGAGDFPTWFAERRAAPRKTVFIKGNHEDFVWLDAQRDLEILPGLFYLPNARTIDLGDGRETVRVGGVGGCFGPSDFERASKVEADPLPQPFVGRSRPQRRIVVLRRPS